MPKRGRYALAAGPHSEEFATVEDAMRAIRSIHDHDHIQHVEITDRRTRISLFERDYDPVAHAACCIAIAWLLVAVDAPNVTGSTPLRKRNEFAASVAATIMRGMGQ